MEINNKFIKKILEDIVKTFKRENDISDKENFIVDKNVDPPNSKKSKINSNKQCDVGKKSTQEKNSNQEENSTQEEIDSKDFVKLTVPIDDSIENDVICID